MVLRGTKLAPESEPSFRISLICLAEPMEDCDEWYADNNIREGSEKAGL